MAKTIDGKVAAMNADSNTERFIECLVKGEVLFFVGSGISAQYPACLPSAWQLIKLGADLFLPDDEPELLKRVLGDNELGFEGIQPEVYYERLKAIIGDAAFSPLALLGQPARPTLAHYLIVYSAAKASLPVVTTNFDTLLEAAAKSFGLPKILKAEDLPTGDTPKNKGQVLICKVHGSIDDLDEQGVPNIYTTMARITQPNLIFLDKFAQLLQKYHVCFIGYSGRDVDLFPFICNFSGLRSPFWIDPYPSDLLEEKVRRIKATLIKKTLDDITLANAPSIINDLRRAEVPVDQLVITGGRYMEGKLATESRLENEKQSLQKHRRIDSSTKELLLATCLHSVSFNKKALAYLKPRLPQIRQNVKRENAVRVNLLMARLCDATSDYVASESYSAEALKETANLLKGEVTFERIALRVRALHAYAMARKMQMGPVIKYKNKPEINFRPSGKDAIQNLARYISHLIRMRLRLLTAVFVEPKNLKRIRPPTSSDEVHIIEAWYWYLDHKIIILAFFQEGLRLLPLTRAVAPKMMQLLYRGTKKQAARVGDAFTIANVGKYLEELAGTTPKPAAEAMSIYGLITDKINKALLHRKAGDRSLERGDRNEAVAEYRECLRLANESGCYATALKAQVALYACGLPMSPDDLKLYKEHIIGEGYKTYIDKLTSAIT
jgi:hypothetical protein